MSKQYFEIIFVNLGHLSTEISVIFKYYPLIFHLFIMVISNVMNIRINLFSYLPIR